MEALTRLVSESLARHGFDRPLDYRRLHWSNWFRCESPHSLLSVPSKPGVFAIAEEILDLSPTTNRVETDRVETGASPVPPAESAAAPSKDAESSSGNGSVEGSSAKESSAEGISAEKSSAEGRSAEASSVEERRFSAASSAEKDAASAAVGIAGNRPHPTRRMLAVTQFFEADDMAFTLDRMLTRTNPMRARLASGRYFVRYVAIDDESQRRSIATALNQWIANQSVTNAGEKASGIGAHFATSLEFNVGSADAGSASSHVATAHMETARVETGASPVPRPRSGAAPSTPANTTSTPISTAPHLDSGAATNIHCPSLLPSGF
ncbi:MAG TPA: hypothetical protein VMD99_15280 [Terriglobales bacterium]|nr:hypothetical protein [Terriglobales bacterium]